MLGLLGAIRAVVGGDFTGWVSAAACWLAAAVMAALVAGLGCLATLVDQRR